MNDGCVTKSTLPEFADLLTTLRNEVSQCEEYASGIRDRLYKIKDYSHPSACEKEGAYQSPNDVFGEIQECIRRLRGNNNNLREIAENLVQLVG